MNKSILLALGVSASAGLAQAQTAATSIMYQRAENVLERGNFASKGARISPTPQTTTANKTTNGATGDWFNYADVMDVTNRTNPATQTFIVYPDSAVRFSTGTFLSYYGFGMSFDPVSPVFNDNNVIINLGAKPDFAVENDDAYILDSFATRIFYSRKPYNGANTVDTLQIDLVRTGSAQTYQLAFAKSAANAPINPIDSSARFADAIYDPTRDQISDSVASTERFRYRIPLTAAFFADSTPDGYHNIRFGIPNGLAVSAGRKIVSYMSFKRGTTYPFGRSIDSVNAVFIETIETDGPDTYIRQFGNDYTSFLWATRQQRYAPPYTPFTFQGHRILIPASAYADPTGFGIPDFSYRLRCVPCDSATTSVSAIQSNVRDVAIVPNPANEQLDIRFTVATASDVNVSLTNMTGQVVATQPLGSKAAGSFSSVKFNVSTLPAGVYFYTVDADGQKKTGRVVVTH